MTKVTQLKSNRSRIQTFLCLTPKFILLPYHPSAVFSKFSSTHLSIYRVRQSILKLPHSVFRTEIPIIHEIHSKSCTYDFVDCREDFPLGQWCERRMHQLSVLVAQPCPIYISYLAHLVSVLFLLASDSGALGSQRDTMDSLTAALVGALCKGTVPL